MRVLNHCYDDLQMQAMYICVHLGDRPSEGLVDMYSDPVTMVHELSRSAHVERNRSGNQHVDRDEIPCAIQFPGSMHKVYITSPAWRRLADRVLRAVIFISLSYLCHPSKRLVSLSLTDYIDPDTDLIAITQPATSTT